MIEALPDSLASAPVEDEELMPETIAAIERASASLERGDFISHTEILREFIDSLPDLRRKES